MSEILKNVLSRQLVATVLLVMGIAFLALQTHQVQIFNYTVTEAVLDLKGGQASRSHVLVLEEDPGNTMSVPEWVTLIERLREFGAGAIGLSGMTLPISGDLVDLFLKHDVVVSRSVGHSGNLRDIAGFEQYPNTALANVVIDEMFSGRHQPVHLLANDEMALSLPVVLALSDSRVKLPPGEKFLVRFARGLVIPSMTTEQALAGSLIPELVRDRIVIIGPRAGDWDNMLPTPTGHLSRVLFHAYAANTLVSSAVTKELSAGVQLLVVLLLSALMVTILWFTAFRLLLIAIVLLVVLLAFNVLIIAGLNLVAPIGEILFALAAAALLVGREKQLSEHNIVRDLAAEYSQRLVERMPARSFMDAPEHWQQILNLVNQTLELNRVLFLERDPEGHRVREIISHNCSFVDITEVRRDYDREPYRTAIMTRSPVKLEHDYLTSEPDEDQYLVALSFAGEVVGFWAMSIHSDVHSDRRQFVDAIQSFSEQIAELLYVRSSYQREASSKGAGSSRKSSAQQLSEVMASTERRLEIFEAVFASQRSATIVYDLFGQVIQMNPVMNSLLAGLEFAAYSGTALDLLVTTTQQNEAYCRGLLRFVILNQQVISLPIEINDSAGVSKGYQLTIGPVGMDSADSVSQAFKITGLLLDLQDVSSLQRTSAIKQDIIERLGFRLRGDAESIIMATSLLADDSLESDMRKEVADLLVEKVESVTTVIEQVRDHLKVTEVAGSETPYPIDAVELLDEAIASMNESAQARRITVKINRPHVPGLVLAQSTALADLLNTILSLMIEDAGDSTEVLIEMVESESYQQILFSNVGFGIPQDRFQHYLEEAGSSASTEFEKLRDGKRKIEIWNGSLQCESAIGSGFRFDLRLVKVI